MSTQLPFHWFTKILVAGIVALAFTNSALAQTVTVQTIFLRDPVPADLGSWRNDPNIAQIIISSTQALPEAYIGIEIFRNGATDAVAYSKLNDRLQSFPIQANIPRTINQLEIQRSSDFKIDETLQNKAAATNMLPEGSYTFCVTVYRRDQNRAFIPITNANQQQRSCTPFRITIPNQVQLIFPQNLSRLTAPTSPTNFTWTPVSVPNGVANYRLVVVAIFQNQVEQTILSDVFSRMSPVREQHVLLDEIVTLPNKTSMFYPTVLQLINRIPCVSRFAWQVQLLDQNNRPIATRGASDGRSEIWTFLFNEQQGDCGSVACTGNMQITPYYPMPNDTIPWIAPPIAIRWGAFCSTMLGFNYSLKINSSSGLLGENSRDLNWGGTNGSIFAAQGIASASNREERAQILITNWLNSAGAASVPINDQLRRGEQYSWTVNGTLRRGTASNNQSFPVSTSGNFNLGLRQPTMPSPENDSTIDTSSSIQLKFTIPTPTQLMYDNPDIVSIDRSGTGALRFASAREKIRVIVSRNADCYSPIVTQTITPNPGIMGSRSEIEQLSRDLFGQKTVPLTQRLAEGKYYWRVEYLDADNADRVYRQGQIWNFTIRAGGGTSTSTITQSECIRISPKSPEQFGTVSDSRVDFTVQVRAAITIAAVRGGRFRVWELQSMNQNPNEVIGRTPLYEASFTGNNERDFRMTVAPSTPASASVWILSFLNSAPNRFSPQSNKIYVWQFALTIDGANIRQDRIPCSLTQIVSSTGVFMYRTQCQDNCIKSAPTNTTPATQPITVGTTVSIGNFTARLTSVSGTPSNLSGEAIVNVEAFRAGMMVEFRGIQVNSAMEVYGGQMTGKLASNSPLPPDVANLLQSSTRLTRTQIESMHGLASDASRIVSGFAGFAPMTLPIGIDRTIEGQRIVLGVMGMVFKPTDARLNVVLSFPMPYFGVDERIGFEARNVCFSNNGIGREFQIALYDDLGFNFGQGSWAFHFLASHNGDPGTYAQFGCNGFEHIRVKGQLKFSRDCIRPVPDSDPTATANLDFTTFIRADGNFTAFATMNRWSPTSLPDFQMVMDTIGIDFSDKENLPGMVFPAGYTGTTGDGWRGFSMKRLEMQFPNSLRTFGEGRLPNVNISGMLIDRTGLSLVAKAGSIIQYPQGNFSGWGASIDSIMVDILSNSLRRGELLGRISVPIFTQPLGYAAVLSRNPDGTSNFDIGIRPTTDLSAPLWISTFTLEQTSYISLRYTTGSGGVVRRPDGTSETVSGGFSVAARLNGSITIQGNTPTSASGQQMTGMSFRGIRFQNFVLSTNRDHIIEPGVWSLASPQHGFLMNEPEPEPAPQPEGTSTPQSQNGRASGFPVSLDSIKFVTNTTRSGNQRLGIQFRIAANLMGEQRGGNSRGGINALSGSTTLSIFGAMQGGVTEAMTSGFDGVQMDELAVDFDAGAVRANGRVSFYNNDAQYGTGFRGAVSATFVKMVTVNCVVQFGSKPITTGGSEDFRYWYVDANAMLNRGIPLPGVPGVGIYGFGGGAWYNMRPDTSTTAQQGIRNQQLPASITEQRNNAAIPGARPGSTNSGLVYFPSYSATGSIFGFFGQITFGTYPSPEAFNCDLKLSFSFTDGLNEISLAGDGYFFTKPTDRNRTNSVRLNISALLRYNFQRTEFIGKFNFTFAAPPVTANGQIDMLFNTNTWYIKAGTPLKPGPPRTGQPITMSIANLLNANAYFMCGMGLEPPGELPEEFISRLRNFGVSQDFIRNWQEGTRTLNQALVSGDGFAFGAMATLTLGNPQSQDIFYASLNGMLGFDISLLNYGTAARCGGSGRAIGWNGWYARGQIYASIEAAVGVNINLFGSSQRFDIGRIGAGCALEGGLPNPEWFRALLAGRIDILGGLISGPFEFQVTIGEPCAPNSTLLANVALVSSVIPENGSTDVPVDVQPQCITNFKINREFELTESYTDGSRRTRIFRLTLPQFEVRLANNSKSLNPYDFSELREYSTYPSVSSGWSINPTDANMAIANLTQSPLANPIRGRYGILVRARIEELDPRCITAGRTCASWLTSLQDGQRAPYTQRMTDTLIISYFTVGNPPDYIPPQAVQESYPRNMQRYYLQDECKKGYVRALGDYNYLFTETPPTGWRFVYKARFISLPNNQVQEVGIWRTNQEIPLAIGQTEMYAAVGFAAIRIPRRNGTIVHFTTPQLDNNRIYAVQIIRRKEPTEELSSPTFEMPAALTSVLREKSLYATAGGKTDIRAQLRTASAKPNLGTAVQSNEKLLYVFFFKTSIHNTLASKMSGVALGRGVANPASVRSAQSASQALMEINVPLTGSELFDPAEVEDNSTKYGVFDYAIDPLLMIDAATTASGWHTSFTTPLIYNELSWLRSRFGYVTPNVPSSYFRLQDIGGELQIPRRASVDAAFVNPLSASEVSSVSSQNVAISRLLTTTPTFLSTISNRVLSVTLNQLGISGGTSYYPLHFNHGLIVPLDFDELKQGATTKYFQNTSPTNRLTVTERDRLSAIMGRLYNPPAAGTYQVDFKYRVPMPTECGTGVDNSGVGIISRQFEFGNLGVAPR
jgi:hypothetical protein